MNDTTVDEKKCKDGHTHSYVVEYRSGGVEGLQCQWCFDIRTDLPVPIYDADKDTVTVDSDGWEDRFYDKFARKGWGNFISGGNLKEISDFIKQTIASVREEMMEEGIKRRDYMREVHQKQLDEAHSEEMERAVKILEGMKQKPRGKFDQMTRKYNQALTEAITAIKGEGNNK